MTNASDEPFVLVLGTAQDAGIPQAGCKKACCQGAETRRVACLAVVDPVSGERWLLDATPDFREQLRALDRIAPGSGTPGLSGIFLTHAHMGHYTGLVHLGREAMGASRVPVHVMPRMDRFLRGNGPWSQLVELGNVALTPLQDGVSVKLGERIRVTPFLVPHRDEFSETVGFRVEGPGRSVAFIPDIDKWERWETPLEDLLARSDVAYLDGTFFSEREIPGRDPEEIPHPFVARTIERLAALPSSERAKTRFIHLNHTNPVLVPGSPEHEAVVEGGFGIASDHERVPLGRAP